MIYKYSVIGIISRDWRNQLIVNQLNNLLISCHNALQVLVEANAENPDSDVEEDANRQAEPTEQVEPPDTEGAHVSIHGDDRVVVELIEQMMFDIYIKTNGFDVRGYFVIPGSKSH